MKRKQLLISGLLIAISSVSMLIGCEKKEQDSHTFTTENDNMVIEEQEESNDSDREERQEESKEESTEKEQEKDRVQEDVEIDWTFSGEFKTYDEVIDYAKADVETTVGSLSAEWEELKEDFTTYKQMLSDYDRIEEFYEKVIYENKCICVRMQQYALIYADIALKSEDDIYNDLSDLYDEIYDDAGDDIYDEIYDGILDEMYDYFYEGILEDAYDNKEYSDYGEWLDIRSDEYENWLDARSDVYEDWLDFRSDLYSFWLDLRSDTFYTDDLEDAYDTYEDYLEDVEKLIKKLEK